MSDELEKLEQQHRAKTQEIEAVIAQALGLSAVAAQEEAETMIDGFENAIMEGETPKEWLAHERRVAATSIGKLLLERYEIGEKILDIQDEGQITRLTDWSRRAAVIAALPPGGYNG